MSEDLVKYKLPNRTARGNIQKFTAGCDLLFGDMCYCDSNGRYIKSTSDTTAQRTAMSLGFTKSWDKGNFALTGSYVRNDLWQFIPGSSVYYNPSLDELNQSGSGQLIGNAISRNKILIGAQSSSSSSSYVDIPKIELRSIFMGEVTDASAFKDILQYKWNSNNKSFLQYNPEVWLFRYNKFTTKYKNLTVIGNELISDPNFNSGSGWNVLVGTISDNTYHCTESPAPSILLQSTDVIPEGYFRLEIDIDILSGKIGIWIGSAISFYVLNETGTIVYEGYAINPWYLYIIAYSLEVTTTISRVSIKQCEGTIVRKKSKKWKHEPHLNGVKYPGSKWFSGVSSLKSPIPEIRESGRHTEFPFLLTENRWGNINIDPWEYVYAEVDGLPVKITDETDLYHSIIIIPKDNRSSRGRITFRFTIVIDNPDPNAECPKLIGELSDKVGMTFNKVVSSTQIEKQFKVSFNTDTRN